jgi:CHAD domain-containing protein
VLLELSEGLEATGLVAPESRSKEEIAEELVAEGGGGRQGLELGDRPGEDAADADPGVDAAAADTEPIAREDGEFAAPHVDAAPARAPLPRTPGIRADDSFAAAGRKVIQLHFLRLQAREAGARSGESVEDVRKMRVATRRLRAAWRLFEDAYRPKRGRRAVRDLKRLATALGVVRDLDVLVAGLDGWTSAGGSDVKTAVSPFRDALLEERREGFAQLSRLMDEQVYQRFVEEHEAFLDATDATAGGQAPNEPTLVRETAPSRVWTAYERVRAHEAGIAWADVVALHALRIEVKRLRYTLEGFREVLGPETAWLIARLTALQDHLGALNDADVAAAKTRAFLLSRAPQLPTESREAIGRYLQLREREIARQRATIGPTWRPIVSPTFRRALGRAVSAL